MTVKELIEALQQCPADYEVLMHVEGFYTSFDEVGIDHYNETVDFFAN